VAREKAAREMEAARSAARDNANGAPPLPCFSLPPSLTHSCEATYPSSPERVGAPPAPHQHTSAIQRSEAGKHGAPCRLPTGPAPHRPAC
jgi:hypothetical protein